MTYKKVKDWLEVMVKNIQSYNTAIKIQHNTSSYSNDHRTKENNTRLLTNKCIQSQLGKNCSE